MDKYNVHPSALWSSTAGNHVAAYLAPNVDARIAELEKENERLVGVAFDAVRKRNELERVLRAECIHDVGQRDPQWYCMSCGNHGGASAESIKHESDCAVARVLGL